MQRPEPPLEWGGWPVRPKLMLILWACGGDFRLPGGQGAGGKGDLEALGNLSSQGPCLGASS